MTMLSYSSGLVPLSASAILTVCKYREAIPNRGDLYQGFFQRSLSRVRRNSHARFLGGKGVVRLPTYPNIDS